MVVLLTMYDRSYVGFEGKRVEFCIFSYEIGTNACIFLDICENHHIPYETFKKGARTCWWCLSSDVVAVWDPNVVYFAEDSS